MMNHKRILVALSLLDSRDAAFERALALAKASGAELYLLHAVPANQRFSYRAAERLQRSTELRERANAAGVNALTVEQHGDPAEIIVLHADARPVDVIVMGTERRTGWARLRERSVAEQVLRRTKRPTLVVRSDDTGEWPDFENVLVAIDLSPASTGLIDTALQLPGGESRQLTVLHAVSGIGTAAAARQQLADVMPSSVGTEIRLHVAAGPAAETIRACAEDASADLIVLGRSKRLMNIGSTAVRVLRNTDRALLIVPPGVSTQTIDIEPSVDLRAA